MKPVFDFDAIVDRRASRGIKWNYYASDVIPMWVADMDFRSPPVVARTLHAKIEQDAFGYELASEALQKVVCDRLLRLYNWQVSPEAVVVLPGLVTGLNAVCRAVCKPGDGMLVQSPIYPPFLDAPNNHGLTKTLAPLHYAIQDGVIHYTLDLERFEQEIAANTRLFVLCNPHNPIGQVYSADELDRMAAICLRHNIIMCSDEIHADLLLGGSRHVPLATRSPEIADRTVTLMAPSKTYNIPGLYCSFAIVPNADLRRAVVAAANGIVPHPNNMGLAAAEAVYADDPETNEWLLQLLAYLTANRDTLVDYVAANMPSVRVTRPDATYLAWLDCRATGLENPQEFFLKQAKVGLNDGKTFGDDGAGFVRLNFGCPRSTLLEGLDRMSRALRSLPVGAHS